jgi:flavin reductase (DIM6/NTAB) family NADH-FMN oxidoreductase RutF
MDKVSISVEDLVMQPFDCFGPQGALLVCGPDAVHANPMTIGWGTFGIMWSKPVVMVMVRPTRHTHSLIAQAHDFTVNWLPEKYAQALQVCGSVSGRDKDKFALAGLHPVKAALVQSPVVEESILSLEARIIYRSQTDPALCVDKAVLACYDPALKDYHGLFFGEVVAAAGIKKFCKSKK